MSRPDILCLGEPLIEFSALRPGEWREDIGGDVSNVAIAARRQGASSGIAARIGADGFGETLLRRWAQEGVDISAVSSDPDAPTGLYFVRRGPQGHAFEYRRAGSAASRLTPELLPREAIAACRVLHLSGITQAIGAGPREAAAEAVRIAREAGVTVSYDPNLRTDLWPVERARSAIHAIMAEAEIALPGLEDARALTGLTEPEEIARFYRDLGPSVVALTLGSDGALVAVGEDMLRVPPHPARLVDATGAGDCFDGAFLAEWLATGDPVAAARYGVVAAGLSVEGIGALGATPVRAEVEAAMQGGGSRPDSGSAADGGEPCPRVALIAHDARKDALVAWAGRHGAALAACDIVATDATGGRLAAALPELRLERVRHGPLGGDQQIGALIAEGRLDALVFFFDPLTPLPHDIDVKVLTRLATVHDIPMACSEATADMLMHHGPAGLIRGRQR